MQTFCDMRNACDCNRHTGICLYNYGSTARTIFLDAAMNIGYTETQSPDRDRARRARDDAVFRRSIKGLARSTESCLRRAASVCKMKL